MLTGSTCSRKLVDRLIANGWGRLFCGKPRPRAGEPWALDNGVFSSWKTGKPWNESAFLRSVSFAVDLHAPLFAVLPDVVGGGVDSLRHSMAWRARLPALPWFLAVQDGMTIDDVASVLPDVAGLFLGGTDAFKASARVWCDLAHAHGRRFHYARTSTEHRLRAAIECGADSADSSQMLWSQEHWARFERWWRDLNAQGSLFT